MNYTPALHWTANEPTQDSEIDQGQKEVTVGSYENMGACDTHRIKFKCQGTKLRVYIRSCSSIEHCNAVWIKFEKEVATKMRKL